MHARGVCVRARVRLRFDYASSMCRAIVIASRPFILRLADSKKPAKNGPRTARPTAWSKAAWQ